MINGDGGCRLWQSVQADSQPKSSGLVLGRRPLGAVLHSSNEPGELSQCFRNCVLHLVIRLHCGLILLVYVRFFVLFPLCVLFYIISFYFLRTFVQNKLGRVDGWMDFTSDH